MSHRRLAHSPGHVGGDAHGPRRAEPAAGASQGARGGGTLAWRPARGVRWLLGPHAEPSFIDQIDCAPRPGALRPLQGRPGTERAGHAAGLRVATGPRGPLLSSAPCPWKPSPPPTLAVGVDGPRAARASQVAVPSCSGDRPRLTVRAVAGTRRCGVPSLLPHRGQRQAFRWTCPRPQAEGHCSASTSAAEG